MRISRRHIENAVVLGLGALAVVPTVVAVALRSVQWAQGNIGVFVLLAVLAGCVGGVVGGGLLSKVRKNMSWAWFSVSMAIVGCIWLFVVDRMGLPHFIL